MITFVDQQDTLHDTSGAPSTTVAVPAGIVPGDWLIGHLVTATTATHGGPGDGWVQLGATEEQGNHAASIWARPVDGNEPADWTWTHGFTRAAGRIAAYRGVQAIHDAAATGTTSNTTSQATAPVDLPDGGWLLLLPSDRRPSPVSPQVWSSSDPLDVKRGEVSGATGSSNQVSSALIDSDRPLPADPAAVRTVNAAETTGQLAVWAVALEAIPEPVQPEPPAPAGSRWSVPLVRDRVVPLLDLIDGIGQRSAGYRFDLLDALSGRLLGELHPTRDQAPKLDHDTTRTITRTLTLELDRAETARVDPIRHRVRPVMVIPGLGDFPLGVYMWADQTRMVATSGDRADGQLVDQMFIVDQELETGFTTRAVNVGDEEELLVAVEPVPEALARILQGLPIRHRITPSPGFSLGSWPAGQERGQAVEALAVDGGYLSPWFDHAGDLRFERTVEPQQVVPTIDWDQGNTIFYDSITSSTNLLDAPNRWVVISNGTVDEQTAAAPIVGVADVPASAPHSAVNRGFVIPKVVERQVVSVAQAQLVAATLAARNTIVETVELDTAADPRHDGHDVIRWRGMLWQEESWSLTLQAGAAMHHRIRRVYP